MCRNADPSFRCFPHVINIDVKAALKALSDVFLPLLHPNPCPPLSDPGNSFSPDWTAKAVTKEYHKALTSGKR